MTRTLRAAAGFVLLSALLTGPLRAAADHAGIVLLPGGGPVPGARVTATRGDERQTTSTDAQGVYRFAGLDEGRWTIAIEMVGFAPLRRDVEVGPGAAPAEWRLAMLPFAEITRGIPIPAPAPARGLAGQGSPAPVSAPQDGGRGAPPPGGPFQRPGAATAPADGPSPGAAAAMAAALAGRGGGPAPMPSFGDGDDQASADSLLVSGSVNVGAIQPSVGNVVRPAGVRLYNAQITMRGGTSAWDARPHSLTGLPAQKPDTSNLNLSGSFGGPLFRIPGLMRTPRNFTVQYSRTSNTSANTLSEFMPTLPQRTGDFSQTIDAFGRPVQIVDPDTGLPFPGNAIPPDRISPQAAALLAYYPLPQAGASGTFNYQIPALSTNQSHAFNGSLPNLVTNTTNQFGLTGAHSRTSGDATSLFGFDRATRGSNTNLSLNWARRFLPSNRQMRFRYTYTRQTNTTEPHFANRVNVSGAAGITGNNQDPINWGPPAISFASGIAGLSDVQYASNRTESHALGVETMRASPRFSMVVGGNVRRQALDVVSQQNARGAFTFNGSFTGHDFADFLLGLPNTSAIAWGNADKDFRAWAMDGYLNGDLRASPNVTMTFGVRWDYEVPVVERLGRLVNLDVAGDFSAVAPVTAGDRIGPITGRRYPRALVHADPRAIQPRAGVAWRPIPTSSIVLRAGYGIYRNTSVYQTLAQQMAQQPPLSVTFNAVSTPQVPLTLAQGFIAPEATTLNTIAFDPDFRLGTVHRWQASAQRDLPGGHTAVVTYLAGRGVNLPQSFIPNSWPAGAPNPCPDCPTGFVYTTSGATSIQHAGQFELRRRLRAGVTWTGTYTLTTATDNASSFTGPGGSIAQNWLDLEAERSRSSFEQRHRFSFRTQYSTGQGIGGGALRRGLTGAIVNGWTLTSDLTAGSGTPRTPVYRVASVAGVTGTVRADLTGEPIHAAPEGYYVNPAAFAPPAPGQWGNAPRYAILGPGQFVLNAGLSRNFPLRNRTQLNWQVNATNVLNRVTYSNINTVVGSPQFGLPTSTSGMRRITTAMNVRF